MCELLTISSHSQRASTVHPSPLFAFFGCQYPIILYKLTIVASPDVLKQFEDFLENFATVTKEDLVGQSDINTLMDELAELSVYIRRD